MDVNDFAQQQIRAGYRLHYKDGIWWQQRSPFYFKPAFEYQFVSPQVQRPSRLKAIVGYSHAVGPNSRSNSAWPIMVFKWGGGAFDLRNLISKKRNQVRKGLAQVEVKKIDAIANLLGDLQEINIATHERTGVGKPATYYTEHYRQWAAFIKRIFGLDGREWWGAFRGDRLVAYYYAYQVNDTLVIDTAKSSTDYLKHNPMDALLFRIMEHAINQGGCRTITYGGWTRDNPSLTHFKAQYGFVREDIPVYLALNPAVRFALLLGGPLKKATRAGAE